MDRITDLLAQLDPYSPDHDLLNELATTLIRHGYGSSIEADLVHSIFRLTGQQSLRTLCLVAVGIDPKKEADLDTFSLRDPCLDKLIEGQVLDRHLTLTNIGKWIMNQLLRREIGAHKMGDEDLLENLRGISRYVKDTQAARPSLHVLWPQILNPKQLLMVYDAQLRELPQVNDSFSIPEKLVIDATTPEMPYKPYFTS